jgi:ketosteroid isomerase-like protein
MSERSAITFANDAFYHAFANRDLEIMDALWSRETHVTCIHPGWGLLSGRDDVMESWQAILTNPNTPDITFTNGPVQIIGDLAYVIGYERFDQNVLAATNIFIRESGRWMIIHHQAGASSNAAATTEEDDGKPETMQ